MVRFLLSLSLALAVSAGASAQTTPGSAAGKAGTSRQPSGTAPSSAINPSTSLKPMGSTPASTRGQSQHIYAAPGEPINVPSGKVGPYDGRAAGRHAPKKSTTLSPR